MGSRTKQTWKQSSRTVTRPSAECQTTFFGRFKQFETFLKKVPERSRDSGRRSRNRRPTVKQRFWMFQATRIFFEKSHGHATVVGGHATVGRLSNNVFWTFQANLGKCWKKSLNGQVEVTRLSADWQTTFFRRFKRFGKYFWKKVAERSRDSGWRSRDRRPTVKQRFLDVSSDLGKFWKKSLNGHATVVEVTRPSADCQTTLFGRFKRFGKYFEKSRWTVTRQWLEVTRPSADCQTTFFGRFKRFGKYFEKSRWTVTRQWSEVTRPSADCQTTFLDVSSN